MTEKRWLKITLQSEPVLVDPITDFLIGVIGAGVETGAEDEKTFGVINCYVEDPDLNDEMIENIVDRISIHVQELAEIFKVKVPTLSSETLEEEDWGKSWKAHFKPFAIVEGLIIAPSWEEYAPLPDEKVIIMDPGMAFGTGHHATTSLSLELLSRTVEKVKDASVLDIGTGTGILGMAGIYFGAYKVFGIDNDPEAVLAATENISKNQLQDHMQVSCEPLGDLQESYSVVVANIVHDVLVEMAADIERVTAAMGWLILSGILEGQQTDNIIRLFAKHGFELEHKLTRQEWAALCLKKTVC